MCDGWGLLGSQQPKSDQQCPEKNTSIHSAACGYWWPHNLVAFDKSFSWIPVTNVHNKNGPKYTQHFPGIKVIFSEGKIRKEWVKWQFVKNDKYNQSGNGAATFSPQVSHHPEFLQVHLSCITFTPCYLSLLMIMVASVGSWNRMNIIALMMICMVVRWWNLTSNSVNHHVWNW